MTRKRFDHPNEVLGAMRSHNNIDLPEGVSIKAAHDELETRVGGAVPASWQPWSPAEPIIHIDKLPDGVTEAGVESALAAMKADGVL